MTKTIMIQGTMSSVGKSLITTGLCRIFKQDGFNVAPFKSQNMSNNSYTTKEGLEMSKAQVIQAEAAGIEPNVLMNPILLKPLANMGSEVIVNGKSCGKMQALEYFRYRKTLIQNVITAFKTLKTNYEIIVIEGAGSPTEINLRQNDIVNMGLAKMTNSPVLLVGDVDCGGVFAQIVGTLILMDNEDRDRVKGTIVNKFRGDIDIFKPGVSMLEDRSEKPVIGVLPYLSVDIEEEDSLIRGLKLNSKQEEYSDIVEYKEKQYDILAHTMRKNLDIPFIYKVLEGKV